MRFQQGQIVAEQYQIISLIGTGSGSEVYKVKDLKRSALLALKLLRSDLNHIPDFVSRFKNEASALAVLQHPKIVRFYELKQDGDLIFFVMDYVEGQTLRQKMRTDPSFLTPDMMLKIFDAICSALNYAHHQGIIHCDIKPENILIDGSGSVRLSDFRITATNGMDMISSIGAGTPAYMAPEQIQGQRLLPQTDIYALGVLLYELLTGSKPFSGTSTANAERQTDRVKWEHIHTIPPLPSQLNPRITAGVDAVVMKCLRKDPKERFSNTLDLLNALKINQWFIEGKPVIDINITSDLQKQQIHAIGKKAVHGNRALSVIISGFLLFTALVLIFALTGKRPDRVESAIVRQSGTFPYPNACMVINLSIQPKTDLYECVTSIEVREDGQFQVNVEWRFSSLSSQASVVVRSDAENHNMYLVDNLNNRLNHIEIGGDANQDMQLSNGDSKKGWFLFPAPDENATHFFFVDGDNNLRSPRLDRKW